LDLRLSLSKITSPFDLGMYYLDRTFAQRIGSAKVKSKSKVAQCKAISLQSFAWSRTCASMHPWSYWYQCRQCSR